MRLKWRESGSVRGGAATGGSEEKVEAKRDENLVEEE